MLNDREQALIEERLAAFERLLSSPEDGSSPRTRRKALLPMEALSPPRDSTASGTPSLPRWCDLPHSRIPPTYAPCVVPTRWRSHLSYHTPPGRAVGTMLRAGTRITAQERTSLVDARLEAGYAKATATSSSPRRMPMGPRPFGNDAVCHFQGRGSHWDWLPAAAIERHTGSPESSSPLMQSMRGGSHHGTHARTSTTPSPSRSPRPAHHVRTPRPHTAGSLLGSRSPFIS